MITANYFHIPTLRKTAADVETCWPVQGIGVEDDKFIGGFVFQNIMASGR